jgi:hypothetical protein
MKKGEPHDPLALAEAERWNWGACWLELGRLLATVVGGNPRNHFIFLVLFKISINSG